MKVRIQFEAQLRQVAGYSEAEIDMPAEATVLDALKQQTSGDASELRGRMFSSEGGLLSTILLFLNDQAVPVDQAATTVLSDGSTVLVLPPISGG